MGWLKGVEVKLQEEKTCFSGKIKDPEAGGGEEKLGLQWRRLSSGAFQTLPGSQRVFSYSQLHGAFPTFGASLGAFHVLKSQTFLSPVLMR